MRALFSDTEIESEPKIPGLLYLQNYVNSSQEANLVDAIDAEPWETKWKRRRQPYGESYGRDTAARRPIPAWALALRNGLFSEGVGDRPFDQMLVNEYFPGQGIAMHRDYFPFDRTVVSLSLLSACVMDFLQIKSGRRASILLQPRSLLVLSDEARYEWQHGIAARKTDRWQGSVISRARRLSVTFRSLKRNATSSTTRRN